MAGMEPNPPPAKFAPRFSLKSLFWLMACIACFFAGKEHQRRWDDHWFAGAGATPPDKYDFEIRMAPGAGHWQTTVTWGDGVSNTVYSGGPPKGVPGTSSLYIIPGRAVTKAERRQIREQHSLIYGTLDRD